MANRVIRDGLLTSETINSLSFESRWLYIALLLSCDDFGLMSLAYGHIRKAAPLETWDRNKVESLLGELVDKGAILPYESGGYRYAAIARWGRNLVRSTKPQWPVPNWGFAHYIYPPSQFKDKETRIAVENALSHLYDNQQNQSVAANRGPLESPEGSTRGTLGALRGTLGST